MFATTLLPLQTSVYLQHHSSIKTNTYRTCRRWWICPHQLLHNPSLFQSIGKNVGFETLHIEQKWYHLGEAYIIWISRSYRKTCCATVCWRQQMIAFSTCNATVIIGPAAATAGLKSRLKVPKLESGHLL
jgi:hypothetical protein